MKKLVQYLFFTIIISVGLLYIYVTISGANNGETAPDFETTLIDGTPFRLTEQQGKYVLLDFWGSWCPPCRKENPKLVKLYKEYGEKLTIVTVALEKDDRHWKRASQKDGFVWKHQIVDQNKFVLMSAIARKYGVTEIPTKFLISPKGKLIGKLSFQEIKIFFEKNKIENWE